MRVCVIGAGPCGLAALKNLLQVGLRDVVCYEEGDRIGGIWAFTEDPDRVSVHERTRTISSRRMSSFDDFPMPASFPAFPSHSQLHAYFTDYARALGLTRYIRLGARVDRCTLGPDGRWTVRAGASVETFDGVLVCTGHHRQAVQPSYPGPFHGRILHSSAYKRADPYRGQRVLVVGAGNSAADIAVDVARVAERTVLSAREGRYVVPKLVLGLPVDLVYALGRRAVPMPVIRLVLRLWLGRKRYGLPAPGHAPLAKPPTVNSGLIAALRDGRIGARPGVERYDGHTVEFTDGRREEFDTIVMATGFRAGFPLLDLTELPPLYLNMTHPTLPGLYFIGLFQPLGCLWRLADHQARVAALELSGRPSDLEVHSWNGLQVDALTFRRQLVKARRRPGARSRRARTGRA